MVRKTISSTTFVCFVALSLYEISQDLHYQCQLKYRWLVLVRWWGIQYLLSDSIYLQLMVFILPVTRLQWKHERWYQSYHLLIPNQLQLELLLAIHFFYSKYQYLPFPVFLKDFFLLRYHYIHMFFFYYYYYHLKAHSQSTFCFHYSEWLVWFVKQSHLPLLSVLYHALSLHEISHYSLLAPFLWSMVPPFSSQLLQCLF